MALYAAILISTSVYFIVFSDGGILERMTIERSKTEIAENNRSLEMENERLRNVLEVYRAGTYPPEDTLHSGYIRPGDRVLSITGDDRATTESAARSASALRGQTIAYLRIAWIVISVSSVVTFLIYGWKSRKKHEDSLGDNPWQA